MRVPPFEEIRNALPVSRIFTILNVIYGISILSFCIASLLIFSPFILDSFQRNFLYDGHLLLGLAISTIVFGILLSPILAAYQMGLWWAALRPISEGIRSKRWFIFMLFLGLFVFLFGLSYISWAAGRSYFEGLVLRDNHNLSNVIGNITCASESARLTTNSKLICSVYPPLSNISATVASTLSNGTVVSDNFEDFSFIALPNTTRIQFFVNGTTSSNGSFESQVGYPVSFDSPEEYEKKNSDRFLYFGTLVGLIIFSIPSSVVAMRQLFENTG